MFFLVSTSTPHRRLQVKYNNYVSTCFDKSIMFQNYVFKKTLKFLFQVVGKDTLDQVWYSTPTNEEVAWAVTPFCHSLFQRNTMFLSRSLVKIQYCGESL